MDHRSAAERVRSLLLQLSVATMTILLAILLFQMISGAMEPVGNASG